MPSTASRFEQFDEQRGQRSAGGPRVAQRGIDGMRGDDRFVRPPQHVMVARPGVRLDTASGADVVEHLALLHAERNAERRADEARIGDRHLDVRVQSRAGTAAGAHPRGHHAVDGSRVPISHRATRYRHRR